jgi:CRISPR-associated protein Csb2
LRGALLARLDEAGFDAPPVVHGHGFTGRGYETARFLALPNVGGDRSDGRIHGAAVWFPPGTNIDVVDATRDALRGLVRLYNRSVETTATLWAGERRPWAACPDRWTVTAERWASAFPVVHERSRRSVDLAEVGRWCEHAGLPKPVELRGGRHPLVAGGVDLAPSEVNRPGRPVRRYGHIELRFDVPVTGPVAVGAGRQFGLGLLAPIPEGGS